MHVRYNAMYAIKVYLKLHSNGLRPIFAWSHTCILPLLDSCLVCRPTSVPNERDIPHGDSSSQSMPSLDEQKGSRECTGVLCRSCYPCMYVFT